MASNTLQAVLDKAKDKAPLSTEAQVQPTETTAEVAPNGRFHRPSRDNRRFIGGHFAPAVSKQLRQIALDDETTIQGLLEEALDLLFVKKGREKIADVAKNDNRKRA